MTKLKANVTVPCKHASMNKRLYAKLWIPPVIIKEKSTYVINENVMNHFNVNASCFFQI